jgi:ribulose-phosphate 3-epimerase
MYKDINLSASIMCLDWLQAGKQLIELEKNELDFLHIDVIDGYFAPDFTMGSSIINLIKENTNLRADFHIMADEPARLFNSFNVSKDDYFTIHQEACRNLHRDIVQIKKNIAKVGVALSPGTSTESLEYILEELDMVVLMTVNPGYMGQKLVPQVLKKVEKVRELRDKYDLKFKISVDGNVNLINIPNMIKSGADTLVLGSSGLFRKDRTIKQSLELIYEEIDKIK